MQSISRSAGCVVLPYKRVSKLGGEFPNIRFCIISEAISGDTAAEKLATIFI